MVKKWHWDSAAAGMTTAAEVGTVKNVVQDEQHIVINELDGIGDHSLTASKNDNGFLLEVENPWAGGTDHMGETARINLTIDEMKALIAWALATIGE
jgi:hypothetical protein